MNWLQRLKSKFFKNNTSSIGPRMRSGFKHNGQFLPHVRISESTVISFPVNLNLADNLFIGHYNFIEASHGISIEEGVQITNYCSILTHSSHISIRLYGKNYLGKKDPIGYKIGPVKIGQFTFVGPHVTIMPRTSIGKGSLVAAYAYVKGDFPDFSIIAGNPAKVIGDTRTMDKPFLDAHPELQLYYTEWASH
jgi:acetyltransferase-like isoleucine patch superfamily enzyme